MPKPVYTIAALAANRVIGRSGRLPWSFPSDTAYFLAMTRGGVMIEGPSCYAELGGALPDRDTIVVSRDPAKFFPGAGRASTLEEALELAQRSARPGPIWIGGGQWLYEAGLAVSERLYLTEIQAVYPGDRYFPEWCATHPRLLTGRAEIENGVALVFSVYTR